MTGSTFCPSAKAAGLFTQPECCAFLLPVPSTDVVQECIRPDNVQGTAGECEDLRTGHLRMQQRALVTVVKVHNVQLQIGIIYLFSLHIDPNALQQRDDSVPIVHRLRG